MSDRTRFRSWAEDYIPESQRVGRESIIAAMKRRGLMKRLARQGSQTQASKGARIVVSENRQAEFRQTDPFERACTFLRQRGYTVFSEHLADPAQRGTRVGRRRNLTPADVIALAENCADRVPPPRKETTMSDGNVAADQLRLFIERIERLEEEKRGMMDDIKDVFLEAKSQGYDPKAMKAVIRLRRMEKNARDEAEAILETYKAALGLG